MTIYVRFPGSLRLPLSEMARGVEILISMFATLAAPRAAPAVEFLPSAEGDPRPHGPPTGAQPPVVVPERLRFLEALGPLRVVAGVRASGGRPYVAFVFSRVVVLECEKERNALYLFARADGWEALAKMGKLDLLRQRPAGFLRRVVHKGDWQGRTRAIVLT